MSYELNGELKEKFEKLVTRYPNKDAALIPALHLIRREKKEITNEAMEYVASSLQVSPIRVKGIVSFYPMFQKREFGRYVIMVCSTLSCSLMGSSHIVEYLEKKLQIKTGETTPDRRFTLVKSECLASCGTAPVMQINEKYYEALTESKIDSILDGLP